MRQFRLSANVPFACRAVDMDLAPDTALRVAVLAGIPLDLDLDACAVNRQVQRALRCAVGMLTFRPF